MHEAPLAQGRGAGVRIGVYIRTVESARGAEYAAVNVAKGLADRGHEVDFLVEDEEGWLLDELAAHAPPIRIVNLRAGSAPLRGRLAQAAALARAFVPTPHALHGARGWALPLLRVVSDDDPPLLALQRYLRSQRPAAVISFLSYPNLVLLLASLLGRGGVRFLVSVQNHLSTAAARSRSRWVRSTPHLMRRFARHADAIVAASAGVASDLQQLGGVPPERIQVIYNPVFHGGIEALAREPVDHPWLQGGGPPVVLGVGKLKPQKDFPTLLRAFQQLRRQRPARLVILGEGDEEPALRDLAKQLGVDEHVDFAGYVRNPFPFYARAAVFALSSAWEGFGNVLVEALACGCPIVSTDCPSGPAEILDGGRYGRLVPVGDADAICAAIGATLDAPPPRGDLIERARAFSFDEAARRYEELAAGR